MKHVVTIIGALLLLTLGGEARAAKPCPAMFRDVAKKYLPDMPAADAVEKWFRGIFDPNAAAGVTLFSDPAFRAAFGEGMTKRIQDAELNEKKKAALLTSLNQMLSDSAAAAPASETSPDATAERTAAYRKALADYFEIDVFRALWKRNLPSQPELHEIEAKLAALVKSQPNDNSPLSASELARRSFRLVAEDKIARAFLPEREKVRLREGLERALEAMKRSAPAVSGEVVPEPDAATIAGLQKELKEYLDSERFRKCIARPARLTAVSTIVSIGFGAVALSDDKDKSVLGKTLDPATYLHGMKNPRLLEQLAWNALLMSSISGLSCVATQAWAPDNKFARWMMKPDNLNGFVLSPLMGAVAQGGRAIFTGEPFNVGELFLETFWVRFISVNKTAAATALSERYRGAGLPAASGFETFAMFISETIGAIGYPLLEKAIFPGGDDDDAKKKKKKHVEEQLLLHEGDFDLGGR